MAAGGGSQRGRGRPARPGATRKPAQAPKRTPKKPAAAAPIEPAPLPAGPFRLGTIPGATVGSWIDRWQERMPGVAVELVPLSVATQLDALRAGGVDAALVRLPVDTAALHVIPLYDELPVVVCAADSHLTAADELTIADLAGEIVIVPDDDVLSVRVPDAVPPAFAPPETTADAVATVAAGVGIVIVPMSLARLHHRKDADHRVLTDGPSSTVALAWPRDAAAPLVDAFIGIVRGRTANSSRS